MPNQKEIEELERKLQKKLEKDPKGKRRKMKVVGKNVLKLKDLLTKK